MVPTVYDLELYNALKEFVRESLGTLEPMKNELRFDNPAPTFKATDGERVGYFFVQDWGIMRFVGQYLEKLRSLPSYKRYLQKCIYEKPPFIWPQFTHEFLDYYIGITRNLEFEEKIFNDIYEELEEWIFTDKRRYRMICLLQNFDCAEELDLGNSVKIRQIHPSDVFRIKRTYTIDTIGEPHLIKFMLEATYEIIEPDYTLDELEASLGGKTTPVDSEQEKKKNTALTSSDDPRFIEQRLKNIVTALRLFKKGDIRLPLEYLTVPLTWGVSGGWGISYSKFPPFFYTGEPYILNHPEIAEFRKFLENIEKTSFPANIEIAIRRFNYLYERKNPEDNFIDCMVGFEALYLHGEKLELSYKLKMRSAHLLGGSDPEEKLKAFKYVAKAYSLRSDIVHGVHGVREFEETISLEDGESISAKDFILIMGEYLRRSIILFLELAKEHKMKDVPKLLDRNLLLGKI